MTTATDKVQEAFYTATNFFGNSTILYCGLYGSQNYGLDIKGKSDVDTKCILLPPAEDILLGKSFVSKVIHNADDGSCIEVKDIREMFNQLYKGNINFLEILYTQYHTKDERYSEPLNDLLTHSDLIANRNPYNLILMAAAMARKNYAGFDKVTDKNKEIVEKHGYNPKCLQTLVRLVYFMQSYLHFRDFASAIHPSSSTISYLKDIRCNPASLETAEHMKEIYLQDVEGLLEEAQSINVNGTDYQKQKDQEVRNFLDMLCIKILKQHMENP